MDIKTIKAITSATTSIDRAVEKLFSLDSNAAAVLSLILHHDMKTLPTNAAKLVFASLNNLYEWDGAWPEGEPQFLATCNVKEIEDAGRASEESGSLDEIICRDINPYGEDDGGEDIDHEDFDHEDWQYYFIQISEEEVLIIIHKKDQEDTLAEAVKGYLQKIRILNKHS